MSWKNFKKEKPDIGKKIVVKGFQTLTNSDDDFRLITDSGIGSFIGAEKCFFFSHSYSLLLRLSDKKELCYTINKRGSKYREATKDDCDFEWMYI